MKYHHRRTERLTIKLRKLKQYKSRKSTVTKQTSHQKTQSPATKKPVNKGDNVNELAEELKAKISEVDVLLEQMRSQVRVNKQSESYPCALLGSLEVRGKGKENARNNKAAKNRKRKERRKIKDKKRFCNAIESCRKYIKNLSNEQLTDEQITLLLRGLKFIPTPVTKENLIRRQLLADFNQFARQMRLQYIFHGEENEPHPFHVKSDWKPPIQPSVALETFLEEVKFELASTALVKPKDNISTGERQALKELSRNKSIILKKSDKGSTTVLMSRQDKLNEGQVLLDDLNNYRPLDKPMVETTANKAQNLIKSLFSEGHIDKMTAKWLSLMPDPPRIPVFYTLTKIHKPTLVGRPIISGCSGPTEKISAFVDHLIQPIAQQDSYLKDTTDFINFIERIKLPSSAILVSMDVTSLVESDTFVYFCVQECSFCF